MTDRADAALAAVRIAVRHGDDTSLRPKAAELTAIARDLRSFAESVG